MRTLFEAIAAVAVLAGCGAASMPNATTARCPTSTPVTTAPTRAAASTTVVKPSPATSPAGCPQGSELAVRAGGADVTLACVRADGKRHGPYSMYWSDGNKAADGQYADGAPAGVWRVWNPTFGKERTLLATIDHANVGLSTAAIELNWWMAGSSACPTGSAIRRTLYDTRTFVTCKKNGTSNGPTAEFHASGYRQAIGAYKNGAQHGRWLGWRKADGTKFGEAFFDAGTEVGTWRFFDPSGKLTKTETYRDGKLIERKNHPAK